MLNDKAMLHPPSPPSLNCLCLSQVSLRCPSEDCRILLYHVTSFYKRSVYTHAIYLLFTEGLEGRSEYHFITNVPPRNGNCTVSPTEGKMLETYFNINCPGWHDEDGVFIYKVLHGESLIQHSQDGTLSPSLLPRGLAQNNYTYNLTVQIFDKYNSFSEETLLVTVSSVLCQDLVLYC